MPTPAKTSRPALIGAARALIEESGVEALTLGGVARAAGVKAPSLYKHFADRATLLKAVEIGVINDLEAVLRAATKGKTARQQLHSMSLAYRRFAIEHANGYALIFSRNAFDDAELAQASRFAVQPLFEELQKAGVPTEQVLPMSRILTAFLHGFVSMESANAFRLGGSVEEAFEAGLSAILGRL